MSYRPRYELEEADTLSLHSRHSSVPMFVPLSESPAAASSVAAPVPSSFVPVPSPGPSRPSTAAGNQRQPPAAAAGERSPSATSLPPQQHPPRSSRLAESSAAPSSGHPATHTAPQRYVYKFSDFPQVLPSQYPLLRWFMAFASERVRYAAVGTPPIALTFPRLGDLFVEAGTLDTLSEAQQTQLIDEIRPPAGRHVTWKDFLLVLGIVAEYRYPAMGETMQDDARRVELVSQDVVERLNHKQAIKGLSANARSAEASATTTTVSLPPRSASRPQRKNAVKSVELQSQAPVPYLPACLPHLVDLLKVFCMAARRRAILRRHDQTASATERVILVLEEQLFRRLLPSNDNAAGEFSPERSVPNKKDSHAVKEFYSPPKKYTLDTLFELDRISRSPKRAPPPPVPAFRVAATSGTSSASAAPKQPKAKSPSSSSNNKSPTLLAARTLLRQLVAAIDAMGGVDDITTTNNHSEPQQQQEEEVIALQKQVSVYDRVWLLIQQLGAIVFGPAGCCPEAQEEMMVQVMLMTLQDVPPENELMLY